MKPNRIILAVFAVLAVWIAYSVSQTQKNTPGPFHAHKLPYQQAKAYEAKGMADSALVFYQLALNACAAKADWVQYVRVSFSIANLKKNNRDMGGARNYLSKTDSVLTKYSIPYDSLRADIYHLQGVLNLMESRSDLALKDFLQSLDLKTKLYG